MRHMIFAECHNRKVFGQYFVETSQARYPVVVERGSIEARLAKLIPAHVHRIFVITEAAVWQMHGQRLTPALEAFGDRVRILYFPGGEARKRLSEVESLTDQMLTAGGDRSSLVIGFGGGIVTDVAGFAAAVFMRGIPVIQVPTTLLAQVDASVGGKLGIDFKKFKNHIGVFCEPVATLICPTFLTTLPERELRSGFAEIVKHCLISDKKMWDVVKANPLQGQDWATLIPHSVAFKKQVIEKDPREKGLRKILNFGHTVGHAVESYFLNSRNRLFHGEAIAVGHDCRSIYCPFKKDDHKNRIGRNQCLPEKGISQSSIATPI